MKKIALHLIASLSALLTIEPNLYAGKHHNRKRVHKAQPNSEEKTTREPESPAQTTHNTTVSSPVPDTEEAVLVPTNIKKPQIEPGTITQKFNQWYGKNRRATLEELVTKYEPAIQQFGTGEQTENSHLLNQAIASFIYHNEYKRLIDVLACCSKKGIPLDASTRQAARRYLNKKRTQQEELLKANLTLLNKEHSTQVAEILARLIAIDQKTTEKRSAITDTSQQELSALRTAIATTIHVRNESGELSDDEAPDKEQYTSAEKLTQHLNIEPLPENLTALAEQAQLCLEARK